MSVYPYGLDDWGWYTQIVLLKTEIRSIDLGVRGEPCLAK